MAAININFEQILRNAGLIVRDQWVNIIVQEDIIDLGRYRDSITLGDAFFGSMGGNIRVVATAPHAVFLEYGREAFNLADKIDPSKWRIGKHGNKYIRIPFRHYTPKDIEKEGTSHTALRQMMPNDIYNLAKELGDYQQTRDRLKFRPVGNVPGTNKKTFEVNIDLSKVEMTMQEFRKYQGMFRNISVYGSRGKTKQSTYHTIRTLTPDSSWMIPAMPAKHVAKRAAEAAQPLITNYLASVSKSIVLQEISRTAVSVFGNTAIR